MVDHMRKNVFYFDIFLRFFLFVKKKMFASSSHERKSTSITLKSLNIKASFCHRPKKEKKRNKLVREIKMNGLRRDRCGLHP